MILDVEPTWRDLFVGSLFVSLAIHLQLFCWKLVLALPDLVFYDGFDVLSISVWWKGVSLKDAHVVILFHNPRRFFLLVYACTFHHLVLFIISINKTFNYRLELTYKYYVSKFIAKMNRKWIINESKYTSYNVSKAYKYNFWSKCS